MSEPMVVEYATWEIDAPDFDAYLAWLDDVGGQCRGEAGCLAYDYRVDPRDRNRGTLFQAWESEEAFARHLAFPAHLEMLAGQKAWTTRDIVIHRWTSAGGHDVIRRG